MEIKELDITIDSLSLRLFGMTKREALRKRVCIRCHEKPKFHSVAGRKEYQISGLCEDCFDAISEEPVPVVEEPDGIQG